MKGQEKDNPLREKVMRATASAGLQALMVAGPDNFVYLTQSALPYAPNLPNRRALAVVTPEGQGAVVCPYEWADLIREQGWEGLLFPYPESATTKPLLDETDRALAALDVTHGRVGIDARRTPQSLVEACANRWRALEWLGCDELLRGLRIVKTPGELERLQTAARHTDRAIIALMHHSEGMVDAVSYALAEMSERLRVHIGEYGGSAAGHLAVLQGLDAQQIYLPPRGRLVPGNLVRVDISNEYRGYWSVGGRTLVVGEPTKAQLRSYEDLLLLNAAAVGMLRPGVAAHHVFDAVCARADREQIPFWREIGVGHGLGTAEREAPFLNATDPTPLAEGMVVALDIYGYGPQRELVHSVDTHVIEADGCRRQSWYRSWDRLNRLAGASARHG